MRDKHKNNNKELDKKCGKDQDCQRLSRRERQDKYKDRDKSQNKRLRQRQKRVE